jgi:DNA (cytosine-5)-methyltransferase 1
MGRQDYETETLVAHALRGEGFDASEDGTLIAAIDGEFNAATEVMGAVTTGAAHYNRAPMVAHAFDARQSDVLQYGDRTDPLDTDGHSVAVAFAQNTRDEVREMPVVGALAAQPGMKQTSYVRADMQVRRLTPRECERLQGFSDGYTAIPWRGRPASECPDGPRYKALGNSMAVPVMRWIGERIAAVDQAG